MCVQCSSYASRVCEQGASSHLRCNLTDRTLITFAWSRHCPIDVVEWGAYQLRGLMRPATPNPHSIAATASIDSVGGLQVIHFAL